MLRGDPLDLLLRVIAILAAVTVHEFAHAWTADRLGDPTPRTRGRLSLNPVVHLDPIGALLLLIAGFGWAKPVEVNPRYFPDPRKGMLVVAAAGPLANVATAFLLGLVYQLGLAEPGSWLGGLLLTVIFISAVLAIFNLLPIPPLDGSKVLSGLLPPVQARAYDRLAQFGPLLLLALILLPGRLIGLLLDQPVRWLVTLAIGAGGL
ncbi:MAG: site-2 protease family protein [Armatimonadetes bacterium]|nr:site-2 protease family protein [Armatimonadota bacterium]